MAGNLETTNLLLGIMAVVSVLEGLLIIGAAYALFVAYRRVLALVEHVDAQRIRPAMERVNAILDDVKSVSATVKSESERVDHAIQTTIGRVDDTVGRVRSNVRAKTSWVIGVVRGLRVAIEEVLHTERGPREPSPGAAGRVM